MKYNCETCNYSTNDKSHFNRHNLSKNHHAFDDNENFILADRTESIPKPYQSHTIKKIFSCKFCEKIYSQKSSLNRHLSICKKKLNIDNEKELIKNNQQLEKQLREKNLEIQNIKIEKDKQISEIKLESLENENIYLKKSLEDKDKQISELKYVLKTSGILKKPTFSSLTFIINNYDTAPNLLPIDNYQFIKSNKEDKDFIEILINCFENGNLAKYLGNILVKAYKKEDCAKQSLWNTDSNRLTYIIKELMIDKSKWSIDKKGLKTSSNIIDPLLNYLVPIIQVYICDLSSQFPEDIRNADKYLKKMEHACNIKKQIDEKVLGNEILKYISPYFYFDKKDELTLKE